MDIRAAISEAVKELVACSGSPQLDAQLLLAHVLDSNRAHLFAYPERELSDQESEQFGQIIGQRRRGIPVAQLTGVSEFWSLPLQVTQDVLIPRPETELLVNLSLAQLRRDGRVDVADLGTGSGAIALALAIERPNARIVATDESPQALEVARGNAARLGISKIDFRQGNWCAALPPRKFHVLVSNPPYIANQDPHLQGDIEHEPVNALVSGEHGLDDLRAISKQARDFLHDGGKLILEHGYDQRDALVSLLLKRGYQGVEAFDDEAGVPRAVIATWNQPD